jgi:hypothetical protein
MVNPLICTDYMRGSSMQNAQNLCYTRVNKKVKAILKLRGNQDREEWAHCAVLTMPVEEFSHFAVQRSAFSRVAAMRAKTWRLLCKIAPSKNNVV